MYGTIARLRLKPGMLEELKKESATYAQLEVDGFINTYVYQMDSDPNELQMVVLFRDRDSYVKNAGSPEQNERYQRLRALLESDPEWHDGEVIHAVR